MHTVGWILPSTAWAKCGHWVCELKFHHCWWNEETLRDIIIHCMNLKGFAILEDSMYYWRVNYSERMGHVTFTGLPRNLLNGLVNRGIQRTEFNTFAVLYTKDGEVCKDVIARESLWHTHASRGLNSGKLYAVMSLNDSVLCQRTWKRALSLSLTHSEASSIPMTEYLNLIKLPRVFRRLFMNKIENGDQIQTFLHQNAGDHRLLFYSGSPNSYSGLWCLEEFSPSANIGEIRARGCGDRTLPMRWRAAYPIVRLGTRDSNKTIPIRAWRKRSPQDCGLLGKRISRTSWSVFGSLNNHNIVWKWVSHFFDHLVVGIGKCEKTSEIHHSCYSYD